MDSFSAGEAGGVFAGAVALLGLIGGGIKWFFMGRDARLKAWETSLDKREREHRSKLEIRLTTLETRLATVVGMVFRLTGELHRIEPGNAVLGEVSHTLHQIYPLDPAVPPDLAALAGKLDGGRR